MRVLLDYLPGESAVATALRKGKPHWSLTDYLLDDLRIATTGTKQKPSKPHPWRPKAAPKQINRRSLASAQRRRAARAAAIARGELT